MARRKKPIPGTPRAMAAERGVSYWPVIDRDLGRFDDAPLRWAVTSYASRFWRQQIEGRQRLNYYGHRFVSDRDVLAHIAVRFRTSGHSVLDTINGDRWLGINDIEAFLNDPETGAAMRAVLETRNLLPYGQSGALDEVTTSADRLRREIVGSVKQSPMDEDTRRLALERLRVAVRNLVGVAADIEYSLQDDEHPRGGAYWMDLDYLLADGPVHPVTIAKGVPQNAGITDLVRYVMTDAPMTNKEILRALNRLRPGFTPGDVGQALRRLAKQDEVKNLGYAQWTRVPHKKETG